MFCFRYSEQREIHSDKDNLNILPSKLGMYHTSHDIDVHLSINVTIQASNIPL